jgi:RimJ/RimL family protein N-acetyltransferase
MAITAARAIRPTRERRDIDGCRLGLQRLGPLAGPRNGDYGQRPGVGSMIRPFRMAELGIGLIDGYRGLGIGQRLIAALETWAGEHSIERIVLQVAAANAGAIRLYERLGYIDDERVLRKDIHSRRGVVDPCEP